MLRSGFFGNLGGFNPPFANVSTLLHLDGANNDTATTDSSSSPKTFTFAGAAKLVTAGYKFGTTCLAIPGSGSWIETPGSTAFQFGTGDFTIEAWLKTSITTEQVVIDFYTSGGTSSSAAWQIETYNGRLRWYGLAAGSLSATVVSDSKWHHIAICRLSGVLRTFVDGFLQSAVADTNNYSIATSKFSIGAQVATRNSAYDFDGFVDEVRVTKGVGIYAGSFTPPIVPFRGF